MIISNRTEDLTGNRYGKLVVLGFSGYKVHSSSGKRTAYWNCLCDCGNKIEVKGSYLKTDPRFGGKVNCGCEGRK